MNIPNFNPGTLVFSSGLVTIPVDSSSTDDIHASAVAGTEGEWERGSNVCKSMRATERNVNV